jgi:hypothetical protein
MKQNGDEEIKQLLKESFPGADRELKRDLWPAMLRRLEVPRPVASWFDWALAAALVGWVLSYPEGVLQLLYHL